MYANQQGSNSPAAVRWAGRASQCSAMLTHIAGARAGGNWEVKGFAIKS